MKFNKLILVILGTSLLSSCTIPLRADLDEFVSTFSIEQAFEEYKEAKYVSTWNIVTDSETKTETDEFYINVKDINNMQYHRYGETFVDDVLSKTKYECCYKENDKYYYEKEGQKVECLDTQVSGLISGFFYQEVIQDAYHSGGMYYGDFILDNIRKAQNFYSVVDNLSGTKSLKYSFEERDENNVYTKITFNVNKLGMLENYSYSGDNGIIRITQEIIVENIK